MSRALWALCALAFTFVSIITPYQAYAVLPAVAGVAVRSAAGSWLVPLATGLGRAVPMAPKVVGLSPLGWVTVTSLGLMGAKELARLVPARGLADAELVAGTVPKVKVLEPLPSCVWGSFLNGQLVVAGSMTEAAEITCSRSGGAFADSWLTASLGGSSDRPTYLETSPPAGGCSASFYGLPLCAPAGNPYWHSTGVVNGVTGYCPPGWTKEGTSCSQMKCPTGYTSISDTHCTATNPQYAPDGIASIQAQPGGLWRQDPRDPDPLPAELQEWLNNGFITKDNFGNTVQMPKPVALEDGGFQLQVNVEGMTSGGLPTVTKNWITVDADGNIIAAKSETVYGTVSNPADQKPMTLPDDYSREKTLQEARNILDSWVKADQELQKQAKAEADAVKDKVKLGDDHWKLDTLGLPEQGIFEAPGVSGLTDRVPGSGSCVTYSMTLAGRAFVVDPCPWIPYYKPTLDWFVIASGVITSVFLVLRVREA